MKAMRRTKILSTLTAMLFATACVAVSCDQTGSTPTPEPEPEIQETVFAEGADISWVTEMEDDGIRFLDADGKETDCFQIMKSLGMNALRFRVWVDPDKTYGPYSNLADVVAKAERAKDAGLDIMIDFHYSDFFADPSRQTKPLAWKDKSMADLKQAVYSHTEDVLEALKNKGITPKWVQIGNETRNGMLWPSGQLWTDKGDIADGWSNYAALSNAGYDAAKSVFEDIIVIVHLNNAWEDNDWWFSKFQGAGGKFDMIGLSHYPQSENGQTWQTINQKALSNIRTLSAKYGKDVMVCEIGVKVKADEDLAAQVLDEFMKEAMQIEDCAGIFYWEPQVNGTWKPEYYNKLGWHAYDLGAFTSDNKPSKVLNKFR